MSTSRRIRRQIEAGRQDTLGDPVRSPLDLSAYEVVEARGIVAHTCGHRILWELLPGVPDDFLKAASLSACPCCGGETGHVPTGLQWPDHVYFAGIGRAHCHDEQQSCKDVATAHRLGLLLKARRS